MNSRQTHQVFCKNARLFSERLAKVGPWGIVRHGAVQIQNTLFHQLKNVNGTQWLGHRGNIIRSVWPSGNCRLNIRNTETPGTRQFPLQRRATERPGIFFVCLKRSRSSKNVSTDWVVKKSELACCGFGTRLKIQSREMVMGAPILKCDYCPFDAGGGVGLARTSIFKNGISPKMPPL